MVCRCEADMGFFDFIVVYLAFGAPFAVYEYLQKSDLLRTIGVFLLWPAAAYRGPPQPRGLAPDARG